jgi:hypothetical protein
VKVRCDGVLVLLDRGAWQMRPDELAEVLFLHEKMPRFVAAVSLVCLSAVRHVCTDADTIRGKVVRGGTWGLNLGNLGLQNCMIALIGGAVRFKSIACAAQAVSDLGSEHRDSKGRSPVPVPWLAGRNVGDVLHITRVYLEVPGLHLHRSRKFRCFATSHCPHLEPQQLLDCLS